ncbi:MAG: hypothetical protein DRQ61_10095 [Gammaproteobacteria bacterium]|nr:MAG: hypothetical protein DRQ56_05650 [Gammaproteobacteria bacterium]RLA20355.1 MAG: hypothetical protein DRQ61_10095 [Gammaproteobacteria bacterium]
MDPAQNGEKTINEPVQNTDETLVMDSIQDTVALIDQVSEYGFLITNSLYFISFGMLSIYILHKLASKFLYPYLSNPRIIKVIFGTLYVLILAISVLLILKGLGFDITIIGKITILVILVAAVAVFFLVPFFPRLPFMLGHIVEINGALGIVDGISTFHTTIRKFDGTVVFIPNALLLAGKILNYSDTPNRRIELNLTISLDSDMECVKAQLVKIMSGDKRVLKDPAPPLIIVTSADAIGIKISAYCWVKNEDWLTTRSDLWLNVLNGFAGNEQISMALPVVPILPIKQS